MSTRPLLCSPVLVQSTYYAAARRFFAPLVRGAPATPETTRYAAQALRGQLEVLEAQLKSTGAAAMGSVLQSNVLQEHAGMLASYSVSRKHAGCTAVGQCGAAGCACQQLQPHLPNTAPHRLACLVANSSHQLS